MAYQVRYEKLKKKRRLIMKGYIFADDALDLIAKKHFGPAWTNNEHVAELPSVYRHRFCSKDQQKYIGSCVYELRKKKGLYDSGFGYQRNSKTFESLSPEKHVLVDMSRVLFNYSKRILKELLSDSQLSILKEAKLANNNKATNRLIRQFIAEELQGLQTKNIDEIQFEFKKKELNKKWVYAKVIGSHPIYLEDFPDDTFSTPMLSTAIFNTSKIRLSSPGIGTKNCLLSFQKRSLNTRINSFTEKGITKRYKHANEFKKRLIDLYASMFGEFCPEDKGKISGDTWISIAANFQAAITIGESFFEFKKNKSLQLSYIKFENYDKSKKTKGLYVNNKLLKIPRRALKSHISPEIQKNFLHLANDSFIEYFNEQFINDAKYDSLSKNMKSYIPSHSSLDAAAKDELKELFSVTLNHIFTGRR